MYSQPNAEIFWAHLWTFIEIPGLALVFTNYQRTITFQISDNQNPTFQITELDSLYTRLCRNNCDIPSVLRTIAFLSAISHSQDSISVSFLSSYTANTTCHSNIPYENKPSQWKRTFISRTYKGVSSNSNNSFYKSSISCKVRVLLSSER